MVINVINDQSSVEKTHSLSTRVGNEKLSTSMANGSTCWEYSARIDCEIGLTKLADSVQRKRMLTAAYTVLFL